MSDKRVGAATRYVAFLRAINVGGHVVKMDRLRASFEALGFTNVTTFIASGNVLFDSTLRRAALEAMIAGHLERELGYEVGTFVRTAAATRKIAAAAPFPARDTGAPGARLYIGFLQAAPGPAAKKRLAEFRTEVDEVRAEGRELYWLCRVPLLESGTSGARLEKVVGPATFRNANTVRRIAETLA